MKLATIVAVASLAAGGIAEGVLEYFGNKAQHDGCA